MVEKGDLSEKILFSNILPFFPPFIFFISFYCLDSQDCGLKSPSIIAEKIPDFDITYGYMLEYFHKLLVVVPSTFWKDHVFQSPPKEGSTPIWIMKPKEIKIMRERIKTMTPTHDMKNFKDPSKKKLKGSSFSCPWVRTHNQGFH